MSRWTFYTAPGTCALATHIALHEAGADFEVVKLDFSAGQQQSPEYQMCIRDRRWLRHKTIKRSFRIQFWATVALNLAAFVVLSPVAQAWWRP